MPPEASWTAIRSPRTSTRGVGFLPAALLPGTPCTGGNFPLPICWVCRLESVYGIARQFLSDEGVRRSRTGVDPGGPRRRRTVGKTAGQTARKPPGNRGRTTGKTAVEPPAKPRSNHRQNRRKTAGKPPENGWETAGKPASNLPRKPAGNRWKTGDELLGDRWKTAGRPPAKPLESRRETTGKTAGKPPGNRWLNRREKPRFWVTFASLNKGPEWLERVSPASFFGPWGGLP